MLPRIALLIALKAHLVAELDGATMDYGGGDLRAIKLRHFRHRESDRKERPCIALRYVSDDVSSSGGSDDFPSTGEIRRTLSVDLVVDVDAPPEEFEEDESGVDDDPTGYGFANLPIELCMNALFPPDTLDGAVTLGGLAWDIRNEGDSATEDDAVSSPDYVRVVERLAIDYRVRAEAPQLILGG